MELIGVRAVQSENEVKNKLVYKCEVRSRTVGNMTALETRYYTADHFRLEKIQEDIFVSGKYQFTVEYFRYKGA